MNAEQLINRMAETDDQSNLCVVMRPGESGIEALLVADEIGRWSIPGGHANGSETHEQAVKREVKEEAGLDVEPEPLFLADHAARKLPVTLFYAVVEPGTEGRPGGGDVTKVRWAPLTDLGSLNGTDRLAIHVAANRIHDVNNLVDNSVEVSESLGFAVGNVYNPVDTVPGIYLKINGKAASSYAHRISEWATTLNWPTTVIVSDLFESTKSALERAHNRRKLTPMLECLLRVSDALWRYESLVAPALVKGHIVVEIGPEIDYRRLLERGLPFDIWNSVSLRVPSPTILFTVGEDFTLTDFQCLKDSIEQMQDPDNPKYHIDRLTPRDVQVPWKMELVSSEPRDNPIVRCPKCKHEGPVMDDFTYLAVGFNGIEPNDEDDLDAQECNACGAKMEWRHVDDMIGLNPEGS